MRFFLFNSGNIESEDHNLSELVAFTKNIESASASLIDCPLVRSLEALNIIFNNHMEILHIFY